MRIVYKYVLFPATPCVVQMPEGAEIIHVGSQNGGPVLWALIDDRALLEDRSFFVFGTGQSFMMYEELRHIGSCQAPADWPGGELVWHVFELVDGQPV